MKKTFRKAIAVLLAVLMVAFSVPFSALAGTPDTPDMFGANDYTVKQNRKWWVDDGVDVSLDKLQSTPEFWSYNSDEKWNTAGSWNFDLGTRVGNFADNGYEDHRNDWKPVVAATVSLQGTNEGMAEAVAKVKDKSDTNAIKNYAAQYYGNYYGADADHTYEAVKESGNIVNPAKLKAGQRIAITVELGGLDIMESGQFKGGFDTNYLKAAYYQTKPSRGDTWKEAPVGAAGCISDGTALYPTAIAFAGNKLDGEEGRFYGAITGKAAVAGEGEISNYIGTDSNGVKPFGKYGLVSFTYSFEVLKDCDASEVFTFDHDIAGTEFEPYYRFALSNQGLQNPELYLITYDDTKSTFANWTQIWTDYAKDSAPETKEYTITFTNAAGTVVDTQKVNEGETPTVPSTNTAATKNVSDGAGHHSHNEYSWPAVSPATADTNYDEVATVVRADCQYTYSVVTPATYKNTGVGRYTCTDTDCAYSYDVTIDKLRCDHADTTVVNAQAATIVKNGYTGDTVCNTCDETIATGHATDKLNGTAYYNALNDTKAVNADNYTDESVAAVTDALKAYNQATVEAYTDQADVNKAADALKAAVAGLVKAVTVEVAATDLGSTTLNGKAQASAKVAVNGEVTLTATPVDGAQFVGWKVNNTLVSTDAEYTTTVVANTTFVPVFKETAADTFTVVFVDSYGNVIDSTQYTKGQTVVAPTAPARPGYTFAGWSLSDDAIAALQEGATIVAQYTKDEVKTYTVKADGATITTSKASAENVLDGVTYDTKVTVTKAGTKAWTVNGATVAYGDTYTFYCGSDIELTAVADTTETASTKVAMVDASLINGSTYKVAFLATRTIAPTDTIVKQGFVYGVDMADSDLVLENVGKTAGALNKTVKVAYADNSYEQTSLVYGVGGNNAGHSANAVAFVTVKAADGSINTVYSEMASYNY
ncbi:MAG: InlB B-repeat-containing protein [Eubacteriales bacterium]|nr:InlB B-repeat-containing protein [Eubacteriales bacterium]